MYRLKCIDGKVNALLKSGNDFVKTEIPLLEAQFIMDRDKITDSDRADYPIHVGDWYFEGEEVKTPKGQLRKKGK